jgi:hypothetical protein
VAGCRPQERSNLPIVRVVATGGTIAGEQQQPGTLGGYEIKKSVNEIVALIPNVQRYARVETEQFSANGLPDAILAARGGAMGWGLGNVNVVLNPTSLAYRRTVASTGGTAQPARSSGSIRQRK